MTEPTLSMPDLYMPMFARLCDDLMSAVNNMNWGIAISKIAK